MEWSLDADSHYLRIREYLNKAMADRFPGHKPQRTQSFFTAATWLVRDFRVWLRKQTARQRARAKHLEAFTALIAWRRGHTLSEQRCRAAFLVCADTKRNAKFLEQLRDSRQELRRAIRSDRRAWIGEIARDTSLSVKSVVERMRPLLRLNGRKQSSSKALPAVLLEDGTLAKDHQQAQDRWIRHFAAIEGGTRCNAHELLTEHRARMQKDREAVYILQGELPSRLEVERACLATATAKAEGPDRIPGELLRYGAGQISTAMYQLMLKMALRLEEPLAFKGGTLISAWKRKGAVSMCSNHRALLVSSTVGKSLHSVFRRRNVPHMANVAATMQIGGLPRYPVQYAAHAARMFASHCRGSCYVMVYLDLREAFYRVARPLLLSSTPTDEQFAKLFADLQMPHDALHCFRELVAGESLLSQAGASEWLQAAMGEFLEETWFKMVGQPDLVRTTLGSRPGDCLADVLFFYIFSFVLRGVREDLCDLAEDSFPWAPSLQGCVEAAEVFTAEAEVRLRDVAWMDDLCVMSWCRKAADVLDNLSRIAGCLVDRCLKMGMSPNLSCNKTESMIGLQGAGSRQLRRTPLPRGCGLGHRYVLSRPIDTLEASCIIQGVSNRKFVQGLGGDGMLSAGTSALFSAMGRFRFVTRHHFFRHWCFRPCCMDVARGVSSGRQRWRPSTEPTSRWPDPCFPSTTRGISFM